MRKKDEFDDYINKNTNFEGDFSKVKKEIKLEQKTHKKSNRIMPLVLSLSSAFLVLAIAGTVTYSYLNKNNGSESKDNKDDDNKGDKYQYETYKSERFTQNYSLNDKKIMEDESLKMLNSISYSSSKTESSLNKDFIDAINNFSQNLFTSALKSLSDFTLSPLSLYLEMNNISLLSSSDKLNDEFDALLGYKKEDRISELNKAIKNNFYLVENATTQIYNSIFFNDEYTVNDEYIEKMTKSLVEAYSMEFSYNNLSKIIDWINYRLNADSTISAENLEFDSTKLMYIFSLLYFKNQWLYSVNDTSNFEDSFYGENGTQNITYMKHSFGSVVEETNDYISFFDRYQNGYKIKYVYSRSFNTPTLEAIGDSDIFTINEDNYKPGYISLSFPKFSKKTNILLTEILKDMGFKSCFDYDDCFLDLFKDRNTKQHIAFIKQFNEVNFNETGTLVKTVTYGGGDKGASEDKTTYYDIKLNRPFVYIIYDEQNIPLYVGSVESI